MSKYRHPSYRKAHGRMVTRPIARDGSDCAICRKALDRSVRDERSPDYITLDHITPKSAGGDDKIQNLRLAHSRCNNARGCEPINGTVTE
jgi:5-methylcytosine-specific restriction endonuclease McrA